MFIILKSSKFEYLFFLKKIYMIFNIKNYGENKFDLSSYYSDSSWSDFIDFSIYYYLHNVSQQIGRYFRINYPIERREPS